MTTHKAAHSAQAAAGLRYLTGATWQQLLDQLQIWRQRHSERRYLLTLDEHMLKDIGLTRADIQQEAAKHFWQC
jgi:uncharacterized protein YjiS (DUF1127 family)